MFPLRSNHSIFCIDVRGSFVLKQYICQIFRTMAGTSGGSGPAINAVIWLLLIFAVIAVTLRVHARVYRQRQFGWDDTLMCVSLVRMGFDFREDFLIAFLDSQLHFVHLYINRYKSRRRKTYRFVDPRTAPSCHPLGYHCNRSRNFSRYTAKVSHRAAYQQNTCSKTSRTVFNPWNCDLSQLSINRSCYHVVCKCFLPRFGSQLTAS